jgi:NADH dehydrogenase FAD-containing subunit
MQSHSHHTVILGGGYAGLMAAARLSRANTTITLVDARPQFVQRIRLHELLAGSEPKTFEYAPLLARRGINFTQGWIERLEPQQQRIVGRSSDGAALQLDYDQLIIALGSTTRTDIPGVAEHTLRLDDPATLHATQTQIRALAERGGRVLVVGAGLTGIEAATELAERYPTLRVTLAAYGRLGDDLSGAAQIHLRKRMRDLSIALRERAAVTAVEAGQAVLSDGDALPFDLCVWTAGFVAPALAREAGLPVDPIGRVLVDATLQAQGYPNIFVVGDMAAARQADRFIRMGCVSAMPMGVHAGENARRMIEGRALRPFGMSFVIRCISLGRREALVQRVTGDDIPREQIWTGRPAVLIKELIGRGTFLTVYHELRWGLRFYPASKAPSNTTQRPSLAATVEE